MSSLINFSDLLQCNLESFSRFGRTDGSTIEKQKREQCILSWSYNFKLPLLSFSILRFPLLLFFCVSSIIFPPLSTVATLYFLLVMNPPRSSFYLAAGALRGTGAENCDFIRPNHCTYTIFFSSTIPEWKRTRIFGKIVHNVSKIKSSSFKI